MTLSKIFWVPFSETDLTIYLGPSGSDLDEEMRTFKFALTCLVIIFVPVGVV